MEPLFAIETDRATLSFSAVRVKRRPRGEAVGTLRITALRDGLRFGEGTWRAGVPEAVARDPALVAGPALFEESDYEVYARAARQGDRLSLYREDALLSSTVREEEDGRVIHGLVSFGAHVGKSTFTLRAGGAPEVSFEVEVFPSKLDYQEDYRRILAEVQEIAAGLALVFLSSTRQGGRAVPSRRPADLEWVILLRGVIDDLERALRHVAERPLRGIARRAGPVPAARVKRADASVRAAVERGRGQGDFSTLPGGLSVRRKLPAGLPEPTLDTPEHRWLAAQLVAIRRRLEALRRAAVRAHRERRPRAIDDLERLSSRLAALARLEPLAAASGEPPAGVRLAAPALGAGLPRGLPRLRHPGPRPARHRRAAPPPGQGSGPALRDLVLPHRRPGARGHPRRPARSAGDLPGARPRPRGAPRPRPRERGPRPRPRREPRHPRL